MTTQPPQQSVSWPVISLIAAVLVMAWLALVRLYPDSLIIWWIASGLVVFVVVLRLNPANWYRSIAWGCVAFALTGFAPEIMGKLNLPWFAGHIAFEHSIALSIASVIVGGFFGWLDFQSRHPKAPAPSPQATIGTVHVHAGGTVIGASAPNEPNAPSLDPAQIFPCSHRPIFTLLTDEIIGRESALKQLKIRLIGPDPLHGFAKIWASIQQFLGFASEDKTQPGRVALVALQGMGGIGKTRLAQAFVKRHQFDFPGGVFWFEAEDTSQRLTQFRAVLADFGVPSEAVAKDLDMLATLRHTLTNYQPNQKRLWVLDNFPETSAGQNVSLPDWLPVPENTALLITSRQSVSGVPKQDVEPLCLDDAVILMTHGVFGAQKLTSEQRQQTESIILWVDKLPLPLVLINASLKEKDLTLGDWFALSKRGDMTPALTRVADELKPSLPNEEARRGIVTVFQSSYNVLSPEAKDLARMLAHLGPDPIPKSLTANVSNELLGQLRRRHFLANESPNDVGSMHRVLADCLRHITPDQSQEDRAKARKLLLSVMTEKWCRDPQQSSTIIPCRQHAVAWWERQNPTIEDIEIGSHIGLSFRTQGEYPKARMIQEQVLDICHILDEENPSALASMSNLASTLSEIDEYAKARTMQERVLEIRRRDPDKEHPDTLEVMNDLASTLYKIGNYKDARHLQEQVLEIRRRVPSKEETLVIMNNLASTLGALSEYDEARTLHEEALEISNRIFDDPTERFLISTIMNNLSFVFWKTEKFDEALKFQEQALNIRRRVLGEEHPGTLTSMSNLAAILKNSGKRTEARTMHEQVLTIRRRILGDEHSDTLTSLHNLASTLYSLDDTDQALVLAQQALAGSRKKLGEQHELTLAAQELIDTLTKK